MLCRNTLGLVYSLVSCETSRCIDGGPTQPYETEQIPHTVEKENFWAIRYLLSTLGKSRGFTTRQETVHVGYDMEEIRWQVREERHQQFLEDIRRVYGEED